MKLCKEKEYAQFYWFIKSECLYSKRQRWSSDDNRIFFLFCSSISSSLNIIIVKQKVKMNDDVNVFEVDQASYSSLKAVQQALDPEVIERIITVSSLADMINADTSVASHNELVKNYVFMVIILLNLL